MTSEEKSSKKTCTGFSNKSVCATEWNLGGNWAGGGREGVEDENYLPGNYNSIKNMGSPSFQTDDKAADLVL